MKNVTIIKWPLQILLGTLLSYSVYYFLVLLYFLGLIGDSCISFILSLFMLLLASTIGVVIGNLFLCKYSTRSVLTVRTHVFAAITAFFLGGVGAFLMISLGELGGGDIPLIHCCFTVTIFSLIGYNTVVMLRRKYWSNRKAEQKE